MDHAAFGTLLIGLDHVRHENEAIERPRATARSRRDAGLAHGVAGWLRRLADVVDPAPRRVDLGLEA